MRDVFAALHIGLQLKLSMESLIKTGASQRASPKMGS